MFNCAKDLLETRAVAWVHTIHSLGVKIALGMWWGGGGWDRSRLLDVFTHFARAMNIYWNRRKFSYNNKVQLTNLADTNLAAVFFLWGTNIADATSWLKRIRSSSNLMTFNLTIAKAKSEWKWSFTYSVTTKQLFWRIQGKENFKSWFKSVTLKNIVIVNENMSSVSFKAGTSYDNDYSHRLPI